MPSAWNMFVKKIYEEGKAKDPKYEFKQALVDASKRKSEMGSTSSEVKKSKTAKKSRGKARKMSKSMSGGKKTRRHRRR
jgi:hypothetical protein